MICEFYNGETKAYSKGWLSHLVTEMLHFPNDNDYKPLLSIIIQGGNQDELKDEEFFLFVKRKKSLNDNLTTGNGDKEK